MLLPPNAHCQLMPSTLLHLPLILVTFLQAWSLPTAQRSKLTLTQPTLPSAPAAIPLKDRLPPTHASFSQYAPTQSCIGHGNAPFGHAMEAPFSLGAFKPFPANASVLAPWYTPTLHSPDKCSLTLITGHDPVCEVWWSLRALLEQPSGSLRNHAAWMFMDMHSGSKQDV